MTNEQKIKFFKETSKNIPIKFKDMSIFLTDQCCLNLDGSNIVGEDRVKIIDTICHELYMGSIMDKNKYLVIGGLIGVTISAGIVATYLTIKGGNKNEK